MKTFGLHLPLYNHVGERSSLQDYVNYFAKNIDTIFCANCWEDCFRGTKVKFETLGNLPIIFLQRNRGSDKDTKAVALSPNIKIRRSFDLSTLGYQLAAVIAHFGISITGGHFIWLNNEQK